MFRLPVHTLRMNSIKTALVHGTDFTELIKNTNSTILYSTYMKEPLTVCMGIPTWLRMEPKAKQSPLRWIKNTTLVFAVIPSDHEVSKDPISRVFFQPFPQCRILKLAQSNNSKHSSQGQSNTNTRGDFKFHSPEKWLSEAPRCSTHSCGWQNAPSVNHKASHSGNSKLVTNSETEHIKTLSLRYHFQTILIICWSNTNLIFGGCGSWDRVISV